MEYKKDDYLIKIFKLVEAEGLVFDWKHITLQNTWVSYDYNALKNKMLLVYPESTIDINLVYKDDVFEVKKESGKVWYTHQVYDPFRNRDNDIVWGYVVIKNKRWEFITTMWSSDIEKHRKVAKTDYIWKAWFAEMCMKTIMKKACAIHFKDIYTEIEAQDNENYDLDIPLEIDVEWKWAIDAITDIEELKKYWEKNKWKWKAFDKYVLLRKQQINENS